MPLASLSSDLAAFADVGWVVLAAVVLWFVVPELRKVLRSRDFSIEVAGMKLSAQRASDELARQIEDLQGQVTSLRLELDDLTQLGRPQLTEVSSSAAPTAVVASAATSHPTRLVVLWADDEPEGNAYEIRSLTARGWSVDTVRTTSDALDALSQARYDVVISDLGRVEEGTFRRNAGRDLLRLAREAGFDGPLFIYTSETRAASESADLLSAGATAVTSSPVALRSSLERELSRTLETAVGATLERAGFEAVGQPGEVSPSNRVDFFGRVHERRIAVEVVNVSSSTTLDRVRNAAGRLLLAANDPNLYAEELLVVTPRVVEPRTIETRGQTVRLVALGDLAGYLDSLKA